MTDMQANERPTVIDVIQGEHKQIEALLARVADPQDADRSTAFDELARHIERHEAAEQAVVHPEMRDIEVDTADQREAEEERGDALLERLRGMEVGTAEFDRLFATFRTAVLAHAEHEEQEEHPLLEGAVDADRLVEMADEFTEVERETDPG
jgi:hypothetical protein